MDLQDFQAERLYFDEADTPAVNAWLQQAAAHYSTGDAETPLLHAYAQAPHSLSVLVALYRFYYYRHRLADAARIAEQALAVSGARLGLPSDWQALNRSELGAAAQRSMTLLRFYLLALKASAYVALRCGEITQGCAVLEKLVELDEHDRLGAAALLNTVRLSEGAT